jgi:hypothetical protein
MLLNQTGWTLTPSTSKKEIAILSRGGYLMANLAGLGAVVEQLHAERTNLIGQLKQVDAALSALGSLNGNSTSPIKRTMSAEARRKISLAQKARWAKPASATTVSARVKPKRVMSASARRKIAAAQKARWAKIKAKKAA